MPRRRSLGDLGRELCGVPDPDGGQEEIDLLAEWAEVILARHEGMALEGLEDLEGILA